ncbi:hypothetical protein DRQ33_01415 [bacterium]|nr:MAG: hypothetical protein DRQ33_01415 [bacterium]
MRRVVLLCIGVILLWGAICFGTDARRTALGIGAQYIPDPNDVINLPANATLYPNWIQLEIGTYNGSGNTPFGQWGLFNLGLGENLAIGGAIRRTDGEAFNYAGEYDVSAPNPGLNLWGAYSMDLIRFGLGVYMASYKQTETDDAADTKSEDKSSVMIFTGSAGFDILDGSLEIGFSAEINGVSSENTNSSGDTQYEKMTGGMKIGGGARAFIPTSDIVQIVPNIGFSTFSYSTESEDYAGNEGEYGDYSRMTLNIGCAANVELVEDGIISVGIGMGMINVTDEIDSMDESETKLLTLPQITVSAEVPTTNWLKIRAGLSKSMGSTTNIEGDVETTTSYSEPEAVFASFGAGVNFHNFTLDITISDDDLFEGPWFLSGRTNNAVQVSAGYNW